MTDVTSHTPVRHRSRRARGAEYAVYFAVIFLTALPFACLSCMRDALFGRRIDRRDPIARARSDAHRITPFIFSA